MNRSLRVVLTLLSMVGILALLGSLFYFGVLQFNYPSRAKFPIRGIDVSHHQGVIDWKAVGGEGFKFVFIKSTEGTSYRNPQFQDNWTGAKQAGLLRGAYHYFSFCWPGEPQAQNFIAVVPKDELDLPPVVDIELGGQCPDVPDPKEVKVELGKLLKGLERVYGRKPILYVGAYEEIVQGDFDDYPLWVANIFSYPRLPNGAKWAFWQYANRVRVRGIDTFVDVNVFGGSEADFGRFVGQ